MSRKPLKVVITKIPSQESKTIVSLLSNGWSVKEIAEKTGINVRTMESAINRLRVEFDCVNIPQLVATFLRNRLID